MPYDDPDLDFSGVAAKPAPNYEGLLRNEATKQGVDPEHIVSLSRAESSLNPSARSPKGAVGLMQVMPATGRRYGIKPLMLADPATNVRVGVSEYKRLLGKYNDPKLAVAAYNAGEGAVDSANGVPRFQETKNHVKKVIGGAKYSDPDLDFTHAGGDPDLDFSGTVKPGPVKPSKPAFAWNTGSSPTVSSARPAYQPAKLGAQSAGQDDGRLTPAESAYDPSVGTLGKDFAETITKPAPVIRAARQARQPVRMTLPGQSDEERAAQRAETDTAKAQREESRRTAANQTISNYLGVPLPRVATEALSDFTAGLSSATGQALSGMARGSVVAPVQDVPGLGRILDATAGRAGRYLQDVSGQASQAGGAPEGVVKDIAHAAGVLTPLLIARNPGMVGALAYTQARGQGASEADAAKEGVMSAITVGGMGKGASVIGRMVPGAGVLPALTRFGGRAAVNTAIPIAANAAERAMQGEPIEPPPDELRKEIIHSGVMGAGFALLPHPVEAERDISRQPKHPYVRGATVDPSSPSPGFLRRLESFRAEVGRDRVPQDAVIPPRFGNARAQYEAQRAAQEQEPITPRTPVQPTEPGVESAIAQGVGARQPLQSPRLVKRVGTQDIKPVASPVEQTSSPASPTVFHSETGPVGHDEIVSTLDDLLSLIPEKATRQRIIDESVAEGGPSYENVVRAAFRKAEEATSGESGNDTPEPSSDMGMEGSDVSRGTQQEPPRSVSSPSPARGLTRNFRAGNNDASMTFADDTHRDLYDLGAKMRYLGRGGQNKPNQRAVGDIAGLRKSLAERLNIPQADIGRMAMDTLDDVKAQMKGVKHGEGRQLANNVQAPTPTVTTVKNRAPQNRAVNPESDSLLAAIQKIGFDSTTQEGADLARYLSTREGGRPGMVNNQRLNDGERRGVDNHLIRSLQEAGFDIKDSNDLMNKVRQEQGGKPVYSTAYNHAAQAARELKPYLEANHSPEIAQTVNTLAEAINNHSEFGQLSDKIAHGEATDAEIKRFGEVGRYELNIDPDAIQSFIETHENAQQSQGRGAQPGVEARESQISGAERKAGEREGDVNDTQRVATQKSGNREFPALSDSGDVREYSVGRGRTETLLPENSGGLRRTTPARADYIHDTLDRLTEQARATKRSLTELVDEHIAQTPLPGQESTAFTPEEASMARSLAANYDTARSTRRAPVKEQTQSLLDTTPTTESRQTAQEQAESQQGEGLANSPLFEGKPDWVNQNLNVLTQGAEKSGLADRIEASAMQRKTAKETARELGTDVDTVRAVRAKRGIPSMEDVTEFEKWLADRQPTHHSELQPRTPEGRFDGPPTTPEYVKPSSVETVHQSELQGALQLKADAWKKVKELRTRIANEPLGGNRSGLRLQLMNWQDAYGKAIELERQARQAIESRANELKQTTVKPKPAPDFTLKEPKTEPAKGEHGHFINALFKSPDADNQVPSFLANPEVRARLGLPRTGKPAETKDALAEAMGLPRSSHISPEALRAWASENGLGQDALSAIDSAHAQYRAKLRAKELGGRDDDPDIITRYRNDLGKKSGDLSGTLLSDPERGYKAVTVLGYDLYQTAKDFGNWSRQMVGKFGERIRPMLRDLWNGIKNSDFVKDERGFVRLDTPEFKRWFGKSKVVDEKGEPLPVYHGTDADFSAFDVAKIGRESELDTDGFFFTSNPSHASSYATRSAIGNERVAGGNVMSVYLSLKAPAEIQARGDAIERWDNDVKYQVGKLKEAGHDGVIIKSADGNNLYVAFEPQQIKSATGNSGEFNPNSSSLTDPPFVDKVKSKLLDLFPGERPPLPPGFKESERGSLRFGKGEKTTTEPVTNKRLERIFKANKGEGDMPPPRRRFKQAAFEEPTETSEAEPSEPSLRSQMSTAKGRAAAWKSAKDTAKELFTTKAGLIDLANAPRSLVASANLHAVFRQGDVFTLTEPRATARASAQMVKALLANPAKYEGVKTEIQNHPRYQQLRDAGVEFTGNGIGKHEEAFMSRLVGKLPYVKRSEQAFSTFLNAQRLYVGDKYFGELERAGHDFDTDPKEFYSMAKFINSATGRGDLGRLNESTKEALNTVLFSPRYIKSRIDLMNPKTYVDMSPAVRKIAGRKMVEYVGIIGTTLGLAAAAGAKVTLNPDDSDFGKIVIGNTHYDITAGFSPYIRQAIKMTGFFKRGEIRKAVDSSASFMRGRLAPVPGSLVDLYKGTDFKGDPATVKGEMVNLITPMFVKDAYEGWKDSGIGGAAKTAPAFFGMGAHTYPTKTPLSSDAAAIHEADRAAHPLPPISDLKKTEVDAKSEITRAMQSHDKNTPAIIQKHIASGAIKQEDVYDIADKASKSDEQRMIDEFKKVPLEQKVDLYLKLSPAGRAKVRQEFQEAAMDQLPNLTPLQQKTLGPKIGQALRAQ